MGKVDEKAYLRRCEIRRELENEGEAITLNSASFQAFKIVDGNSRNLLLISSLVWQERSYIKYH